MGGFMGWFLTFLLVAAIFNAEKLPALRKMLEEKFKDSVDAAKEGSKIAKTKIKKVKSDIENKRTAAVNAVTGDGEENTPEEIAESLQFMGNYIKPEDEAEDKKQEVKKEDLKTEKTASENTQAEEKPIDLENRD